MLKFISGLFFLLISLPLNTFGQKEVVRQNNFWFRYMNTVVMNAKWQAVTEIENRRFVGPERDHQWLLPRFQVRYTGIEGVSMGAGCTYFKQALPQDPQQEILGYRTEIRPHQVVQIESNKKDSRFDLIHRYGLEERFFQPYKNRGNEFNFRSRYRIMLIWKRPFKKHAVRLNISNEVMFNFGKQVDVNYFDQNRFGVGADYSFNKNLRINVDYIYWYQQRSGGDSYFSRNILRLTLFHRINLKNEKKSG